MQIIRLATFNANNVYDGHDDPDKRDGPEKDARGLQAVTEILRDSEADVISLQEIENLEMLEEILSRENLSERYPYSILVEGNDRKGIDVAVMSRYPIARYETHRDEVIGESGGEPSRFLRDLLEVDVELPTGKSLRLFSNHYVAQGNEWCDSQRLAEARATGRIVREAAEEIPTNYSVVMGDFNDGPESPTLEALESEGLSNVTAGLPPSWGIPRPHEEYQPVLFDQILVNKELQECLLGSGVLVHPSESAASDHRLVWADFKVA